MKRDRWAPHHDIMSLPRLFEMAAQNPRKELNRIYTDRIGKHRAGRLNKRLNRLRQGIRPPAKWEPMPRPRRSG